MIKKRFMSKESEHVSKGSRKEISVDTNVYAFANLKSLASLRVILTQKLKVNAFVFK